MSCCCCKRKQKYINIETSRRCLELKGCEYYRMLNKKEKCHDSLPISHINVRMLRISRVILRPSVPWSEQARRI